MGTKILLHCYHSVSCFDARVGIFCPRICSSINVGHVLCSFGTTLQSCCTTDFGTKNTSWHHSSSQLFSASSLLSLLKSAVLMQEWVFFAPELKLISSIIVGRVVCPFKVLQNYCTNFGTKKTSWHRSSSQLCRFKSHVGISCPIIFSPLPLLYEQ